MSDAVDDVLERVRARVVPDADERAALDRVVETVIERTQEAIETLPVDAEAVHVGSTARGTWMADDRDVDIFVCLSPDLSRSDLETYGLQVGRTVLPDGREEYADHPYVTGSVEGFDIDLVPCYAVDDPTSIRSPVDRTPFHNRYLSERLDDELADEIRLAKRFLSGIGAYGSDLRTRGFSGFLVELLVAEYGGFRPLVEAAADWEPPVYLDPEGHGNSTFDDPLVVIDPTDPERNVAAVCSPMNVARLQHYSRELLADPREAQFEPRALDPLTRADIREALAGRETTPIAIRFDAPDLVDDQLYPQLEKSLRGLIDALERHGFDVLRGATFAAETAVLLVELEVAERPAVDRHEGPPVAVREHATDFYRTYVDDPTVTGPFIEGDRYVVEREREFATARAFLESPAFLEIGHGARVESALRDDYTLLFGEAVAPLADEFGRELAAYADPIP